MYSDSLYGNNTTLKSPLNTTARALRTITVFMMPPVFKDEDDVPMELRHLPEFKELLELKRLRKQKIHELQSESALMQHIGYKVQHTHTVFYTTANKQVF